MAEIFNFIVLNLISKNVNFAAMRAKFKIKRKRRFLIVPDQILENVIVELRSYDSYITIDLDNDPLLTAKQLISDENYSRLGTFFINAPCFKHIFLRKYIKYTNYIFNEENVKRIIYVTSDYSLFSSLNYKNKIVISSANPSFISDLDDNQKEQVRNYNDAISKRNYTKIKFDSAKDLATKYGKMIS